MEMRWHLANEARELWKAINFNSEIDLGILTVIGNLLAEKETMESSRGGFEVIKKK
jgi:hypothetical protein